MPAGWSIRSTAMMKPTIRFGLPNTHSGNPNGCFGKSNNRFGTPASLFDCIRQRKPLGRFSRLNVDDLSQ
jgi:hypothetical protein